MVQILHLFMINLCTCFVCSCVQKTTMATLIFFRSICSLSLAISFSSLRISILCLSSPYFELWSVDGHEQQFHLFSLVFSRWYFCKMTAGLSLYMYTLIQTSVAPTGQKRAFFWGYAPHENITSQKKIKNRPMTVSNSK